jgi:DNA-binding beta-propeller fold protein YncE
MRRILFPALALILLIAALPSAFASDLRQVGILDVPGRPGFDAIALTNGALMVAHQGANSVDVFDSTKRRLIATIKDLDGPHGIAVSEKTGRAYVANSDSETITVVSTKDWKTEDTIQLNDAPYALAITPDGRRLFAANWRARSITAIDLDHGYRQTSQDVNGSPAGLYFDGPRNVLYTTLQDVNQVLALDGSLRELKRVKLEASMPTGITGDTAGRRLFVSVRFAVLALDADSGQELGRVAAAGGVDGLWYDASSQNLYAVAPGAMSIIQTNGGFQAVDEIKTDVKGHTLAYDPAHDLVYVPGGREGRSKLLILKHITAQQPQGEQVAATK